MLNRSLYRRGFTIAELIIVMMIIVLLVAILLPALSSARERARKVAGQAQLASIAAACESYQLQFGSAPGYVDEASLGASGNKIYENLTSTENLVLSLMGGVSATGTAIAGAGINVDVDQIGVGPKSDSGRRYGAFYSPKPDEIAAITGQGTSTYGTPTNVVPTLVDSAGKGMPILYFRANRAGSTPCVISIDDTPTGSFQWRSSLDVLITSEIVSTSGEVFKVRTESLLSAGVAGGGANAAQNLSWIATNPKLSTVSSGTASSANNSNDVLRGQFILISAGSDGMYFSTNQAGGATVFDRYSDLDDFDDITAAGG